MRFFSPFHISLVYAIFNLFRRNVTSENRFRGRAMILPSDLSLGWLFSDPPQHYYRTKFFFIFQPHNIYYSIMLTLAVNDWMFSVAGFFVGPHVYLQNTSAREKRLYEYVFRIRQLVGEILSKSFFRLD